MKWCHFGMMLWKPAVIFPVFQKQLFSTTVNSPLAKPKIQASKTEVIQGWEGFEVTCEVDMPSRSSLELIWDYPGKGVSYWWDLHRSVNNK